MKFIYTASRDGKVARWNVDNYLLDKNFENGHSGWISQIVINKKESWLFTCGGDNLIIEWDCVTGTIIQRLSSEFMKQIYSLALS